MKNLIPSLFNYNRFVRRILTIAIVLLLGLPAVSPLFALAGGSDPSLPACCRRDGKHHCMAMAGMTPAATSSGTQVTTATVTERCPFGSRALPGASHRGPAVHASSAVFAGILSHPSVSPQTESRLRISAGRSRQKRGPPSRDLA